MSYEINILKTKTYNLRNIWKNLSIIANITQQCYEILLVMQNIKIRIELHKRKGILAVFVAD